MVESAANYPGGQEESGVPARRPVAVTLAVLSVARGQLAALLSPAPGTGPPTPSTSSGVWSLPRRPLLPDEALEDAARTELSRTLGQGAMHLEQLYAWGEPLTRRGAALEVAYLSLIPVSAPNTAPAPREWWPVSGLPELSPGHREMLDYACRRLRRKLEQSPIARSLLPAEFSLSELQLVYEVVQGRSLDKRNFRKWVLASGLVEATARERRDGAHRPARLYRFAERGPGLPD